MQALEHQRANMAAAHGKIISRLVEDAMNSTSESDSDLIVKMSNTGTAMLDAEVWFAGFSSKLASLDSAHDDMADRVISAAEEAQEKARAIHRQYSAISDSHNDAEVRKIAQMASESATMLFDTLEKLRWEMLDRQADNDISAGRLSPVFDNMQDLIASLKT